MNKLRLISESAVRRVLGPKDANRLVELSFRHIGTGKYQMPPKIYLNPPKGDFRAMPAYAELGGGIAGVKWICVFPENAKKKLPTVIGTLLLNDANTGELLAVIQANTLTALRTGGAGAVASSYLAVKKPKILAIVGAGVQAGYQLTCHAALFRFKTVRVWSPFPKELAGFVSRHRRSAPGLKAEPDLERCVRDADIICTVTPSRKPLVKSEWVKDGAHINAIGADAPGKQELEPAILKRAKVFVDDWEQASHSGEINVPVSRGDFSRRDLTGTLSDVVLGKAGRRSPQDVTIFDSTGLAIQDLVLADYVYKKAKKIA